VAVVGTNRRCDIPAHVRRFARFGVDAAESATQPALSLPDLSSAVDCEIVAINLRAVQALYAAAMLEELRLFQVIDRLIDLCRQGLLPLGSSDVAMRLSDYDKRRSSRLSEAGRRDRYAAVLGMPSGADGTEPNREFDELWVRFIAAVASWSAEQSTATDPIRGAGRDLAINLSLHGASLSLYAASELAETIRDALDIVGDPAVCAAFGARDGWQVIEQIATRDLAGARNNVRLTTRAAAGAAIIGWLAAHVNRLAPSSTSQPVDTTDAPLSACESWLAVGGDVPGGDERSPRSVVGDFSARVNAILAAIGTTP